MRVRGIFEGQFIIGSIVFFLVSLLTLGGSIAEAVTEMEISETSTFQNAVLESEKAYAGLGFGMAAGDFNGDGIEDFALGQPREASPRGTNEEGVVSVFWGGSHLNNMSGKIKVGKSNDGWENLRIYASVAGNHFGVRLAAGDFNKDGIDDLVVVAQSPSNVDDSALYILFGASNLSGDINVSTASGVTILNRTNMYVSDVAVGDLDGDGYDDLIIADPANTATSHQPFASGHSPNGGVYVILGGTSWPSTIDLETQSDLTVLRNSGNDLCYIICVAAGDVNGDGKDDLIMGAPREDNPAVGADSLTGRVYVIYGGSLLPPLGNVEIDTQKDVLIYGAQQNDQIGGDWSVTEAYSDSALAVGDVNGDTIGDIIIGAPLSMGQINHTGAGKAEIVFGSTSLPPTIDLYEDYNVRMNLSAAVEKMGIKTGYTVGAEDINQDGIDDIIVASPSCPASIYGQNGWVHVIYGKTSLGTTNHKNYELDTDADLNIKAHNRTDHYSDGRMGTTFIVGDFNSNGFTDILLGAPKGTGVANATSAGWVLVKWDVVGGLGYAINGLQTLTGQSIVFPDQTGDGVGDHKDVIMELQSIANN